MLVMREQRKEVRGAPCPYRDRVCFFLIPVSFLAVTGSQPYTLLCFLAALQVDKQDARGGKKEVAFYCALELSSGIVARGQGRGQAQGQLQGKGRGRGKGTGRGRGRSRGRGRGRGRAGEHCVRQYRHRCSSLLSLCGSHPPDL